jgi:hypothetical protein
MLNLRTIASLLMTGTIWGTLGGSLGCARSSAMVISVENVPPEAGSLSIFATRQAESGVLPSMAPLTPYDLPQPAPGTISFLLAHVHARSSG